MERGKVMEVWFFKNNRIRGLWERDWIASSPFFSRNLSGMENDAMSSTSERTGTNFLSIPRPFYVFVRQ